MSLLAFIFGLIYGSFLNVVIFRLPENISIISPRSFCQQCKIKIPFYNNIPLLSFIIQKGKCFNCNSTISIQYPIIEFLLGFICLFSHNFLLFPESIFFVIISGLLICIIVIDYKYFIIPLELIISILIICIPYILFFSDWEYHIYGMIMGIGYLSIVFIFTWFITKKQPLGFGDLQLILILGLWLGPIKALTTIFLGSILGIIYWIYLGLKNGYVKDIKLPFGSFLSIAAIIMYLIPLNWRFI